MGVYFQSNRLLNGALENRSLNVMSSTVEAVWHLSIYAFQLFDGKY